MWIKKWNLKQQGLMTGLFCLLFVLTACNSGEASGAQKELVAPAGVSFDTAIAVRSDISQINQYDAYVKAYSEGLYFEDKRLNLLSLEVMAGQKVNKGDVLARLDTEPIDKSLEAISETVASLQEQYQHNNQMKEMDIQIAALELENARLAGSGAESALYRLESLKLSLQQDMEQQALVLDKQNKALEKTKLQLKDTEITAPFDGTIVYVEPSMSIGQSVAPFKPVIYISDNNTLTVEYDGVSFSNKGVEKITAQIADRYYELEYLQLSLEEYIRQSSALSRIPPANFDIVNRDDFVQAGQYVLVRTYSKQVSNAVLVPVNSLYYRDTDQADAYVYVMQNGQKVIRDVKLGVQNASYAEILSGVQEGEEVYVKQ